MVGIKNLLPLNTGEYMTKLTVSWFSAGVSSAVATWLVRDSVDRIVYQHIDDQHEDTLRFVRDVERWIGKPIEIIQSWHKSVDNVCRWARFANSIHGAVCTRYLKRELRKEWEGKQGLFVWFNYVWGFDSSKRERARAQRRLDEMKYCDHTFPLIERGIDKEQAHAILERAGIKRPAMYDLGYPNNNCVGCIKAKMGYWNKIKKDFPGVFSNRAKLERDLGMSFMNGKYLDELKEGEGRDLEIIVPECGAACEVAIENGVAT